jgi:hypothetical protein
MGTDIHLAVEVYDEDEEQWEPLPPPPEPCFCISDGHPSPGCYWCKGTGEETLSGWYGHRNYLAFAILADVRNGAGFAGVYTHEPIEPIDVPRGMPDERITGATWDALSHEHSLTWVTLEEVETYDYDQPLQRGGVVELDHYRETLALGKPPEHWCGGISGHNIVVIDEAQAKDLIHDAVSPFAESLAGKGIHVQARWTQASLRESAGGLIEAAQKIRAAAGDRKCRLIMDFDS